MPEKAYKRLKIWEFSHQLAVEIYKKTESFPKDEIYGITSQIRRSSFSVPTNIVEGHASSSAKEFLQFLNIANRSLVETEYLLEVSLELKFINQAEYHRLEELRKKVSVMLRSFIAAQRRKLE